MRVLESVDSLQSARIALHESEMLSVHSSFTNLLKIEQDKNKLQQEITAHSESIINTYEAEKKSLKKQVRRLKWQRAGLGVLVLVVVGISL